MTRQQRRVLLFIQDEADCGRYVSMREVADALCLSSVADAYYIMRRLVEHGYLTSTSGKARSYRVVRRIEPVCVYLAWDGARKRLVPLRERNAA